MIAKDRPHGWYVQGFYRYRPENRLSRGFVAAAPWVNVALLISLYLYLNAPNVLQPGIMIQLPEAPFTSGSHYGHNLVIMNQEVVGQAGRQEAIFFDDERFIVNQPMMMEDLAQRLGKAVRERPDAPLVIEADYLIQHGTIITVFNMASAAGFKEVNVATLPSR